MAKLVITKIVQKIDNVNADLNTNDDYVGIAEANITLGGPAGDVLATKIAGSYVRSAEFGPEPLRVHAPAPSTAPSIPPSTNQ